MSTKEIIEQLRSAGAEEITVEKDGRITAKFPPKSTEPDYPPHWPWVEPYQPYPQRYPWQVGPLQPTVSPLVGMYAAPFPYEVQPSWTGTTIKFDSC